MINRIKERLARTGWIRGMCEEQIDLSAFTKKPSGKFLIGLIFMGISYIIGWPLISVLGGLAFYFSKPFIFIIGSPIAYGISHLVFIFGAWIAGKDGVNYARIFIRWLLSITFKRILGKELIIQIAKKHETVSDNSINADRSNKEN